MSYNLTQDVLNEIALKSAEIYKTLNIDIPDDYLEALKKFHQESRENISAVKHLIHKKNVKLIEDVGYKFPLCDYVDDKVWEYLHIMYLLLENGMEEPNNEILVALVNKLDKKTDDFSFDNCMKEVQKVMGNGFDMTKLLENIGGMDEFNNVNQNTDLLRDIVEDTKEILNKEGDVVDNLVDSIKNLTGKYYNKVQSGEITQNDVIGNLMGLMNNPGEIKKMVEGIDITKLPDPEKLMNKMMADMGNLGLPLDQMMKGLPIADMMKGIMDGNDSGFDPSKLLGKLMGESVSEEPLTEEQLKEMEEYYSKMTIGGN